MVKDKLEQIGKTERAFLETKREYQGNGVNEYSASHKNALSDGDVKGKDDGSEIGYALPDASKFDISSNGIRTQHMDYSKLSTRETDTTTIGGKYDREGNPNISKSGRLQHMALNIYNESNEYGEDSVTIDETIKGQFFIK